MPSMPPTFGPDALAARIAALQAERLTPVPRASHVIAIDADDLALVLNHLRAAAATPRNQAPPAISADTAAARERLEAAVRSHTSPAARLAVLPGIQDADESGIGRADDWGRDRPAGLARRGDLVGEVSPAVGEVPGVSR